MSRSITSDRVSCVWGLARLDLNHATLCVCGEVCVYTVEIKARTVSRFGALETLTYAIETAIDADEVCN